MKIAIQRDDDDDIGGDGMLCSFWQFEKGVAITSRLLIDVQGVFFLPD